LAGGLGAAAVVAVLFPTWATAAFGFPPPPQAVAVKATPTRAGTNGPVGASETH
jgi:hypothetical protein